MDSAELSFESYRRELTGYCYRMLGSAFDADDAVQETMVRAWKSASGFEGRASLRSWLYKIATNVCLDALRGEKRRALPMDLGPASPPRESLLRPWPSEDVWMTPIPDDRLDPAEVAEMRDSVRLAFVTALQHLPPRQRAVLILCSVLKLSAAEAASVLETSAASVNSALQRARATLAALPPHQRPSPGADTDSVLLDRYVDAFQRYDMGALMEVIHDDAVMTMPPFELWLRGNRDITAWMVEPGPSLCRGSVLVPARANGVQAWGQYKPSTSGSMEPWAVQVNEVSDGKLSRLTFFLDVERLFPLFGLPPRLPLCSASMRVLFVMHHRSSPDGFVGDAFTSLGYDITTFTVVPPECHDAPNISVTFPDPRDYDAVVAFGGIWAVHDSATIGNWIGDEIDFTRSAIAHGVPVLGICFGGQMLAAALGGTVSRAPAPDAEIGWCPVSAVPASAVPVSAADVSAVDDSGGIPGGGGGDDAATRAASCAAARAAAFGAVGAVVSAGPWFQWHYDRFTLPPGATLLARSPGANQAFIQGRSLGLQFHPELNTDVLGTWLEDGGAAELAARGVDASELMRQTESRQVEAGRRAHSLVECFVRDVASMPPDATILT